MGEKDTQAIRGVLEGYRDKSGEILPGNILDIAEAKLIESVDQKGFSFPTNEGMRKVTKVPELNKLAKDPVIEEIARNIRITIAGVMAKNGGLYAGTNAFHHGHLAYLTKSEGILSYDMNAIVPYGFAFIVGLVGGINDPHEFRRQVTEFAINPMSIGDFFKDTSLENAGLLSSEIKPGVFKKISRRLFEGVVSTMNGFNPALHGKNCLVPPVFCWDETSYNYFRQLVLQDKVVGMTQRVENRGFIGSLAKAVDIFGLEDINSIYFSSIFDPRFAGPKARKDFIKYLKSSGMSRGTQIIESFLNGGWIVYDLKE